MVQKLNVHDVVTWSSSGGGTSLQKTGSIVAIVPAGTVPDPKFGISVRPTVKGRNHESYVIKVRNDKHYWPIVSRLTVLQGQVQSSKPQAGVNPQSAPAVAPQAATTTASNVSILKTYQNDTTAPAPKLKNYVGFSLDFSGSMDHIANAARTDYNAQLEALKSASVSANQETSVFTIACGWSHNTNRFLYSNTDIAAVNLMKSGEYHTNGNTPLFNSVNDLINALERQPDINDPNVSVLLIVTTDGEDNVTRRSGGIALGERIARLRATDRWTVAFRVPNQRAKNELISYGIDAGNIAIWEQTKAGVEKAAAQTVAATQAFYSNRVQGVRGSNSFFANVTLTDAEIKQNFVDITQSVLVYPVYNDSVIQEFIENQGVNFIRGNAFYQLTKPEDFQNYKELMVQDTVDGKIYGGDQARQLLNLPSSGTIRLRPGQTGKYTVFVQSTSVNRKLMAGTRLIYKR